MTFGDLLDSIAYDAGDNSPGYRAAARRWINFARAKIAKAAQWPEAIDALATFNTSSAQTDGIYTLSGYSQVVGNELFDETTIAPIFYATLEQIRSYDPSPTTFGPPTYFADAGADATNNRKLYLWPIPNGTFVIRFAGYRNLTDISEAQEGLSVDPFFGPLANFLEVLQSGLRYHHDLNNSEDVNQTALQLQRFERDIMKMVSRNRVAQQGPQRLENVRGTDIHVPLGRLDPSRFTN